MKPHPDPQNDVANNAHHESGCLSSSFSFIQLVALPQTTNTMSSRSCTQLAQKYSNSSTNSLPNSCPNQLKKVRFGRKSNEFCPNVYQKPWIWTENYFLSKHLFQHSIFNMYFGPYSEIICQKPATSVFYFVISPVFGGQCMLVIFLEMLIVLHTAPVSSPTEAE